MKFKSIFTNYFIPLFEINSKSKFNVGRIDNFLLSDKQVIRIQQLFYKV